MKKIIFSILILSIFLSSCTEKFDFNFDSEMELLVVDGVLTNQDTIHYIRLTKSINKLVDADFSGSSNNENTFPAVEDATITLSDNLGNTEVLEYVGSKENAYPEVNGHYKINEINGVAGRTYTLKIEWQNKEYTSVSTMPTVPVIEQISFRDKYLESKNETVTIPLLHFTEPQNSEDYYLLHYSVDGFEGSNRSWSYSIISDKYMTENIAGMDIDDGQSGSGKDFYQDIYPGVEVVIFMESLTKPSFNFYEGVIAQFESDGGAFSQAPATPEGNISNGALGLFRCSAVSKYSVIKE